MQVKPLAAAHGGNGRRRILSHGVREGGRKCFGGCGGDRAGVGHGATGAVHGGGGCILTAEWGLWVPRQRTSSVVLRR